MKNCKFSLSIKGVKSATHAVLLTMVHCYTMLYVVPNYLQNFATSFRYLHRLWLGYLNSVCFVCMSLFAFFAFGFGGPVAPQSGSLTTWRWGKWSIWRLQGFKSAAITFQGETKSETANAKKVGRLSNYISLLIKWTFSLENLKVNHGGGYLDLLGFQVNIHAIPCLHSSQTFHRLFTAMSALIYFSVHKIHAQPGHLPWSHKPSQTSRNLTKVLEGQVCSSNFFKLNF